MSLLRPKKTTTAAPAPKVERQPPTKASPSSEAPPSESATLRPPPIRTALIMVRDNAVAAQAAVRIVYRILECQKADIDSSASIVLRRCVLQCI